MTHGEEFRAYMKAANPISGNHDDRHLSEALMIAYCRGEISEAERETAEAHLVGCEQCIALFRNARDFLEPASADENVVTTAKPNDAWQSLWERVRTVSPTNVVGAGTTVVEAEFQRPRARKFFLDSRLTLAMAASLLISFGGLGLLGWRLFEERQSRRQSQEVATQLEKKQRELEQRLSQVEQSGGDQLNREREQRLAAEAERDRLQDLLAAAQPGRQNIPVYPFRLSSERGAEEGLRLNFTSRTQAVKLRLFRNKPYEFPEYAIEFVDERGAVVRAISRVRPTGDEGGLNVLLNRAAFGSGKYKLRLFGQRGSEKKQLGEYELSVTVAR